MKILKCLYLEGRSEKYLKVSEAFFLHKASCIKDVQLSLAQTMLNIEIRL